jgi:transcription antitermination factor NusG
VSSVIYTSKSKSQIKPHVKRGDSVFIIAGKYRNCHAVVQGFRKHKHRIKLSNLDAATSGLAVVLPEVLIVDISNVVLLKS